jgi:hypothetical protein
MLCICQPLFPGETAVDQLVEIIKVMQNVPHATFYVLIQIFRKAHVILLQVLGTPTREEIRCMNPNYTEFRFPQIKAHPWHKVDIR